MRIGKYSFGIGDRFGRQGKYQLEAIQEACLLGWEITPVWNKSNREHKIIHTRPEDTRVEADEAVTELNWQKEYHVDADHVNLTSVEPYISCSDFFTLDVADYINRSSGNQKIREFMEKNRPYTGTLRIPGIQEPFRVTDDKLSDIASRFLYAIQEAGRIYRYIESKKGTVNFIAEVSMDEVPDPQTPVELFFILSGLAGENIPLQTIAPKFSGRFNKGVDYTGDISRFEKEFEEDLLVIDFAVKEFGLPENLKLSVHSGSDKFSIYPLMGKLIRKYDKGIHVKTAGTTWLEEVIGLAAAGGKGLELAKEIYLVALDRMEELTGPYETVIDINKNNLPDKTAIGQWEPEKFVNSLRHIPDCADYNPDFRQMIHVSYKIAAEMGSRYYAHLGQFSEIIGKNVQENLFERHLKRLFGPINP